MKFLNQQKTQFAQNVSLRPCCIYMTINLIPSRRHVLYETCRQYDVPFNTYLPLAGTEQYL